MAVELWGEPQQPQLDLLLGDVLLPSLDYPTVQQQQQQQQQRQQNEVAERAAAGTSGSQQTCVAITHAEDVEGGSDELMFIKFKQLQEHAAAEVAAHHADAAAAAVASKAVPSPPAVAPASESNEQQAVTGALSVQESAAEGCRTWDKYVALGCVAACSAAGNSKMQQQQHKQQHAQPLLLLPAALAAHLVPAAGDLASTAMKTAGNATAAAGARGASCSLSAVVAAAVATAAAASPKRSKRQPAERRVAAVPAAADSTDARYHQQQAASQRLQYKQHQSDGPEAALPQQLGDSAAARPAATSPALPPRSTAERQTPCNGAADTAVDASQQAAQHSSQQTSSQQEQQLLQLQLSPGEFLVEVPVCVTDSAGLKLVDQLLADGLKLAAAVPQLPVQEPAAAAAAAAGGLGHTAAVGEVLGLQQGEVLWDASWGDLWHKHQQQQDATGSSGAAAAAAAAAAAWWCGPAAQAMLSGTTMEDAASSLSIAQQPAAAAAAVSCTAGDSNNMGTLMLESLLAADMQPEGGDLLLPVPLLPDDTAAAAFNNSSGSGSTFFRQYLQGCGYKRQPTAHLELYFDWSVLQPLIPDESNSSRFGGGKKGLIAAEAAMQRAADGGSAAALEQAAKRSKTAALIEAPTAAGHGKDAGVGSNSGVSVYDAAAWLAACRKLPAMQQMHQELLEQQQQQQALQQSQMPAAAAAAGVAGGSSRFRQLQLACCKAVVGEALQLHDAAAGDTAAQIAGGGGGKSSNAVSSWGEGSAGKVEQVPPEVAAAAAAAASAAQDKAQQLGALQQSAASAAAPAALAHAAVAAVNGAAEQHQQQQQPVQTDLEFFMQLQGTAAAGGSRAGKRRFTATQLQYKAGKCTAGAAAAACAGDDAGVATAVSGGVSNKHPRTADVADAAAAAAEHAKLQLGPQHEAEQQQQQQNDAADLALTGARHDSATDRDEQHQQQLLRQQRVRPQVLRVDLQGTPLLQLLLALQANRQALLCNLSHLQCPPGPQLTGCKLWDDSAAQAAVDSCHAAAAAGPLNAQQKQAAKHFVGLLLLAQSAGCLLHYGVRMAHLFLKHGLQKLPSVGELCKEAAAALKLVHDALEKGATPAAAAAAAAAAASKGADAGSSNGSSSSSSSVPVDHPKLACLKALLVKLKAAKPVRSNPRLTCILHVVFATAAPLCSMAPAMSYTLLLLPLPDAGV
jgi:hypothetical protein